MPRRELLEAFGFGRRSAGCHHRLVVGTGFYKIMNGFHDSDAVLSARHGDGFSMRIDAKLLARAQSVGRLLELRHQGNASQMDAMLRDTAVDQLHEQFLATYAIDVG